MSDVVVMPRDAVAVYADLFDVVETLQGALATAEDIRAAFPRKGWAKVVQDIKGLLRETEALAGRVDRLVPEREEVK